MNKNKVRLTESQLHNIIKESVKKVLKEGKMSNNRSANYLPGQEVPDGKSLRHDVSDNPFSREATQLHNQRAKDKYTPNEFKRNVFTPNKGDALDTDSLHRNAERDYLLKLIKCFNLKTDDVRFLIDTDKQELFNLYLETRDKVYDIFNNAQSNNRWLPNIQRRRLVDPNVVSNL